MGLKQSNLEGTTEWNPKKIEYKKKDSTQSTLELNSDLDSIKKNLLCNRKKFAVLKATIPVSQRQNNIGKLQNTTDRRYIGVPCDDAQDIKDLTLRLRHIEGCEECQRMYRELDEKINQGGRQ